MYHVFHWLAKKKITPSLQKKKRITAPILKLTDDQKLCSADKFAKQYFVQLYKTGSR